MLTSRGRVAWGMAAGTLRRSANASARPQRTAARRRGAVLRVDGTTWVYRLCTHLYIRARAVHTSRAAYMPGESRKVQKVGTSTLSVSLPKDWAERVGIQKGDILLFEDLRDGSLRVAPSRAASGKAGDAVYVINADLCTD